MSNHWSHLPPLQWWKEPTCDADLMFTCRVRVCSFVSRCRREQRWNVTNYIYSSVVLKYKVLVLCLSIFPTLYLYSATFWRKIFYFILYSINLITLVTLQIICAIRAMVARVKLIYCIFKKTKQTNKTRILIIKIKKKDIKLNIRSNTQPNCGYYNTWQTTFTCTFAAWVHVISDTFKTV